MGPAVSSRLYGIPLSSTREPAKKKLLYAREINGRVSMHSPACVCQSSSLLPRPEWKARDSLTSLILLSLYPRRLPLVSSPFVDGGEKKINPRFLSSLFPTRHTSFAHHFWLRYVASAWAHGGPGFEFRDRSTIIGECRLTGLYVCIRSHLVKGDRAGERVASRCVFPHDPIAWRLHLRSHGGPRAVTARCRSRWFIGRASGWLDRRVDRRVYGRTDRRMSERANERASQPAFSPFFAWFFFHKLGLDSGRASLPY